MINVDSFPRALRAEARLLLDCSRTQLDPDIAERIARVLQYDLNWSYLIRAAFWHGVLPLLYYNLKRVCADAVPSSSLHKLQTAFQSNTVHNFSLAAELIKILRFLEDEGVIAVAFKGPTLAALAYGNIALRQFCDLDVLVKEHDFLKAKDLFLARGFRPWQDLTPSEEMQHFRSNHAYTLVRAQDGLRVDLHWRITQERYAFGLDVESLWRNMTRTSFGGKDVLGMSAEDLLLVLCIHGSKHCWERLAWVCDVAEMIRASQGLRWDEILEECETLNIETPVLLGLRLAHDLLDAPVPISVMLKVRKDRGVEVLSRQLKRQLFLEIPEKLGPVEKTAMLLRMRSRVLSKTPYLLYRFRTLFTLNERDFDVLRLPVFLRFVYYPLRLIRLATAYGWSSVVSKSRNIGD